MLPHAQRLVLTGKLLGEDPLRLGEELLLHEGPRFLVAQLLTLMLCPFLLAPRVEVQQALLREGFVRIHPVASHSRVRGVAVLANPVLVLGDACLGVVLQAAAEAGDLRLFIRLRHHLTLCHLGCLLAHCARTKEGPLFQQLRSRKNLQKQKNPETHAEHIKNTYVFCEKRP